MSIEQRKRPPTAEETLLRDIIVQKRYSLLLLGLWAIIGIYKERSLFRVLSLWLYTPFVCFCFPFSISSVQCGLCASYYSYMFGGSNRFLCSHGRSSKSISAFNTNMCEDRKVNFIWFYLVASHGVWPVVISCGSQNKHTYVLIIYAANKFLCVGRAEHISSNLKETKFTGRSPKQNWIPHWPTTSFTHLNSSMFT